MKYKDYYEQLGVERDATETDIKRAYRRLARKYHPDVSKASDAEERFKEVGEAYAVLKDTEKRAAYDQLGADWQSGQDFSPPPEWDAGFEFSGGGANFSDFFDSLFSNTGGGFRQHADPHVTRANRPIRGEDHHAKVLIDLEDAFNGSTRAFTLRTPQVTSDGHVTLKERTLNVKIPKGVKTGQQIRLSGQGAPGLGDNQAGDLYLEVEFKPHRLYTIEDGNIFLDLPIAPWEAALGATVKTPTPGGSIDLKIPPGTSHGRKLRLKGRGIPGKPPGDLFVNPVITVPPADSDEAKALYKQMREQLSFDPRATLGV